MRIRNQTIENTASGLRNIRFQNRRRGESAAGASSSWAVSIVVAALTCPTEPSD